VGHKPSYLAGKVNNLSIANNFVRRTARRPQCSRGGAESACNSGFDNTSTEVSQADPAAAGEGVLRQIWGDLYPKRQSATSKGMANRIDTSPASVDSQGNRLGTRKLALTNILATSSISITRQKAGANNGVDRRLRFQAPMKTWLVRTSFWHAKARPASDSAGPKNDSVKFYSRRAL
jgi:hypothetical protein